MMAFLSIAVLTSFIGFDKRKDKAMDELWQEYDVAKKNDRIQKASGILEDIKDVAREQRRTWDFYRACSEYLQCTSMRNWKLYREAEAKMDAEIREYGEPVLDYLLDRRNMTPEELIAKVQADASVLRAGRNADVYEGYGTIYSEVIVPTIRNDYEFVLWNLYSSSRYVRENADIAYEMLRKEMENAYPQAAIAEYHYLINGEDPDAAELKDFASRYEGKAVSLLAYQSVAIIELARAGDKEDSEYFKNFKECLKEYINVRDSYRSGVEKIIADKCDGFDDLMNHLDEESLSADISDGYAEFYLRNIDKLKIRLLQDGEAVYENVLENHVRSYFAKDTIRFNMPVLNDGNYVMEFSSGSRVLGERQYLKYSLSMACRQDADGLAIYVADHLAGRPLECVDLEFVRSGNVVKTVKDFRLHGFTRLPEEVCSLIEDTDTYFVRCTSVDESGRRLMSKTTRLRVRDLYSVRNQSSVLSAAVMLERAAYNPDETVRFKAVIYESSSDGTLGTASEGTEVSMELRNPKTEVMSSKKFRVNEFGSIAGEFVLDGVELNGIHTMTVRSSDGNGIGSSRFTVDEYVLPSFDLTFDPPHEIFYEGCEVMVSGKVRSFAGHSISSALIETVVSLDGKMIQKDTCKLSPDGSFTISFKDIPDESNLYRSYSVEVKVTDLTGETKSFDFSQPVLTKPRLMVNLQNCADGSVSLREGIEGEVNVLSEEHAGISCAASYGYGMMECDGLPLEYRLLKDEEVVQTGDVLAGDVLDLSFEGLKSGLYRFVLSYGETETGLYILKIRDDDMCVCPDVENVFMKLDGNEVRVQFGSGRGPVWAAVELFDEKCRLLESEVIYVEKGELKTLEYSEEYDTGVRLNILYFRDGRCHRFSETWSRPIPAMELPLSFSSFRDEALPGTECSVSIRTTPDAEVLVSVFDIATEQICQNHWRRVRPQAKYVASVPVSEMNGVDGDIHFNDMGREYHLFMYDWVTVEENAAFGLPARGIGAKSVEEAIHFQLADDSMAIREDFSESLAFEPFLRPDEDGTVNLDFMTSDKLSTYVVSVFAHDKNMNNEVVRKDVTVSLPVMVSVAQPQYLYAGDRYVLNASVSNASSSAVQGVLRLDVFHGKEYKSGIPLMSRSTDMLLAAGGASAASFEMDVPSGVDTLGFRLVFSGTDDSSDSGAAMADGLFVTVPVYSAEQVVEEAHSAVLLEGKSEEILLDELKGRFVNGSSAGAECFEMTVVDMLNDALPLVVEPQSNDAISLSEAMYVNLLAAGLHYEVGEPVREYVLAAMDIASKILACRDADGGFAWFEGMDSSPIITAVVLDRFAGIRDRGLLSFVIAELGEDSADIYVKAMTDAVEYLDSKYFNEHERPYWYGRLSLWQYISVRSKYVGVPFDEAEARRSIGAKEYRKFEKSVKRCLAPDEDEVWTDGAVMCKARMLTVLDALSGSEKGLELAKSWGLHGSYGKIRRSMKRELESLKEYAVQHQSGGVFYPNAVLPFRGLLETEAYAHSVICDLFRNLSSDEEFGDGLAEMADGIRLWIMLQKETQQWDHEAGFVDAMASAFDASDGVKATKIMILKKRFLKPFDDIKAAGNGFKVSVSYYRDGVKLSDGDILYLGERITAEYSLWSEENRSFVRLDVPRPACMRPEQQLSGWAGGLVRPLSHGVYNISPYAYREVKTARTLYWIDVFPEENTVIEEELFVTQEGIFSSPVAEIESLYAPHYRANDVFRPSVSVRQR